MTNGCNRLIRRIKKIAKRDDKRDKDNDGKIKIRAIVEELRNAYSYNDVRLALLF